MNDQTDAQLLQAYAERNLEAAFAELVRRHVDLVHTAALRMVCDAHLAKDVTQAVFVALANQAAPLANRPVLAGWLHRTAQNIAAQTVRTDVRRRAREQEATAMNTLLSETPDASWQEIAPHLDTALGQLDDVDRDAVLLRYFEKKSAREMAAQLGISDDAAQKRVSRAVERLREFFTNRGVTVGASGLAVVISANAVQAAPVGLALTISTAAALTGTTLATTATITTATKAIAMTALQKTVVTATIAVLAGAGIYEARQASQLRDQVRTLQRQQAPLNGQVEKLNEALIDATNRLTAIRADNERLNRNSGELLKLRGEVGVLRRELADLTKTQIQAAVKSAKTVPRSAWKLKEPRRLGEFQNVGTATPEAAAETVLWAAQANSTNLVDMIHLPIELLNKARTDGLTDVLTRQLAAQLVGQSIISAKDEEQQVWIDGGEKTEFTQTTPNATNTYSGVIVFRLSGRTDLADPNTERHTNLLFANIDGDWKLVIPGVSPEIRK